MVKKERELFPPPSQFTEPLYGVGVYYELVNHKDGDATTVHILEEDKSEI